MNAAAIAAELARFVHAEQVTELRALNVGGPGRTFSGWFDGTHLLDMARNALALTRQAAGVYFVPNPVNPAVAAKRMNVVLNVPKGFRLTHDEDIIERRYLMVDMDPRRLHLDAPTSDDQKCPTTARELAFAKRTADRYVRPFLCALGFAAPIVMCSGNGIHLVYRYSTPLPTAAWGTLADPIAETLRTLSDRFTCFGVSIDADTYTPSRMLKVPGTIVRKGDATRPRPYRLARIIEVPDGWRAPDAPPDAPPGGAEPAEQHQPDGRVEAAGQGRTPRRVSRDDPRLFDRGERSPAVH
jgi:hypothetical protein